ncbi:MAG: single-stranded-DNA-specific exonuclease RecJ, partial [Anaerolineae bacterium]|nr:single-stranded-DNA-specific exonuclease RecJ [Anaerolineae bacterium]
MTGQRAKWHIYPQLAEPMLGRFANLPPFLVQCLYNRGLTDADHMRGFLAGEWDEVDPFQIRDMAQAVGRIRQATRGGELIAIYGDFDADGVTGTALLFEALSALGARAIPYIPHRADEGYGLNQAAVRRLARRGVSLIVTVDCGSRALREIDTARSLGLDVIVTDHHSLSADLPSAVAVVNTRREDCPYPFKGLSGVGMAFKLAQALLLAGRRQPLRAQRSSLDEEQLLDLVALGTVADVSPLHGENRYLVKKGLARLARSPRPGLEALMQQARVAPGDLPASTVGYVLAPRLNAAGRMDHAMLSYKLLVTTSSSQARELAALLEERNLTRREVTRSILEAALAQVSDQGDQPLLFAGGADYHEGVLGLVAQRLCDEFYRPAVVTKTGEREAVSSARSVEEFDITAALDECSALLKRHGGHAKAAGFTVSNDDLPDLRRRLLGIACDRLAGLELRPALHIDAELSLGSLTPEHFALCRQLEPIGAGNPEPLLLSHDVEIRDKRLVG